MVLSQKLPLPSLENTRDLGGMITADGKTIRRGRLIRSGELSRVSDADLRYLHETVGVKSVVDLRTAAEIAAAPDRRLPQAEYLELPLLDESFLGIARDEYSVEAWMNLFRDPLAPPEEVFAGMYRKLLFDAHTAQSYRAFFSLLLRQEEGAVLWHCSAGKDRVGVLSALLEVLLGVEEETAIEDYLLTGRLTAPICEMILSEYAGAANARQTQAMRVLLGVDARYIRQLFSELNASYGGAAAFAAARFGLDAPALARLKALYLE